MSMSTGSDGAISRQIRVLFVVLSPADWPGLRSMWAACTLDPRVLPRVVLAASSQPDRAGRLFPAARAFLLAEGIPFHPVSDRLLDDFRPDVVFLPPCDLGELPPAIGEAALTARGVRIAHAPDDVEVRGGGFRTQRQFNQPLHGRAWRIFVRSEAHRRMFGRYCTTGSGHVVVSGSPALDPGAPAAGAIARTAALRARIGERVAVLWTPRFESNPALAPSSFQQACATIFDLFDRLSATHALILRPDPLLFLHLRTYGRWTADQAEDLQRRIGAVEHVILDEDPDRSSALELADAMILESGVVPLTLLERGRPVFYFQTQGAVGLEPDEPLSASVLVCADGEALAQALEAVTRERPAAMEIEGAPDATRPSVGAAIIDHVVQAAAAGEPPPAMEPDADARHAQARAYWERSTNTYLAPPDYYRMQGELFSDLLRRLGPWENVLDVGCGDGRYTLMLADHARRVTGCDISPSLIQQARAGAAAHGRGDISYRVEALDAVQTLGRYDLVSCCGVLSGFLDVRAYLQAITLLRAMVEPGGLLVTKESLSLGEERIGSDAASGYVAVYRNLSDYLGSFASLGFELQEKTVISTTPQLEGSFFVFRRP